MHNPDHPPGPRRMAAEMARLRTKRRDLALIGMALVCWSFPTDAVAHSGALNAQGCHAGSQPYHCHRARGNARPSARPETSALTGTASVIDGDTLAIHGHRIRLHGIDAPESGQTCEDAGGRSYRCGQVAALALADRIGRRPVTCIARDTDRYGRRIAVCEEGGRDLNAWMVAGGHALAYRRYSRDYVGEEAAARDAGRGLWQGRFVAPWDWRRGLR